jgi:hypothetical protein
MLTNKIYQTIFLLFIITACASPNTNISNLDSTDREDTSRIETENKIESLEKNLEAEREARLKTERELEKLKQQQVETVNTVNNEPDVKEDTNIIRTPKTDTTTDIASEYKEVVNAYVAYLRGLPVTEGSSACSSSADLSQLNQMQRAALRDACGIVGHGDVIVVPTYPSTNPGTDPQRQPENDQTVDSLIKIFDAVLRNVGR